MLPDATLDRTCNKRPAYCADGEELRNIQNPATVGFNSVTFLTGPVKGKPLRGGWYAASGSESKNIHYACLMFLAPHS